MIVGLREAEDERLYGGKAVQLGAALRAGLPVPDGVAISAMTPVGELARLSSEVARRCPLGRGVAVRSSAIGEDSATASFAGQHATVLGVRTEAALVEAIGLVNASARTQSALAYRRKLGLPTDPQMAIVVQVLVHADTAGVLFSRHPVTGADERVVEATWGLGEAVVAGLVTPDRYRIARGGRVLERTPGDKDLAIRYVDTGGTQEVAVGAELVGRLCLDDDALAALDALTTTCERVFVGTQDLEWAFEDGKLHLLQRRAITRGRP